MTIYQLLLILLTVLALSAGQVLFKLAANEMHFSLNNLLANITNVKLLIALFVYAIATILWLITLKFIPLRIAYPFMGLAFIFVPIFANIFLGEDLYWQTFSGAALICGGIWVSLSH